MKLLILLLISSVTYGQTTYFIQADSVRLRKVGATSNLIIESGTRAKTNAFLRNYNNGRTDFAYAVDSIWKMNDSTFIARRGDGNDTLVMAGGAGVPSLQQVTTVGKTTTTGIEFTAGNGIVYSVGSSALQNLIYADQVNVNFSVKSIYAKNSNNGISASMGLMFINNADKYFQIANAATGNATIPNGTLLRTDGDLMRLSVESAGGRIVFSNLGSSLGDYERHYHDSLYLLNPVSGLPDTTNWKPVVINTTGTGATIGEVRKSTYWPTGSGGGFSVTNESNNRVITSVSAGVGNAEANMNFDGSVLTVTGQIQQGGTAGITNGYLRTNSTNLASTTDLNPGVALYGGGAGVAVYGFDLGYNATSARYRNRMFMFGTSADIAFSATNDTPPTAQSGFTDLVVIRGDSGNMGIGVLSPTGVLHLKAGTVAANTAPIKFTSGTILGTIEAGAKEYNNAHYETTAALNRLATGGAIKDFLITSDNSGTGETDLFTYTTKASTLAVDGEKLIFNIGGTFNDLTATAQLQFYFGGTSIGNTGALTVSAIGGWSANIFIIRTSSTTVRALVAVTTPGASTAVYTTQTDLTGLTLSGTNIIKVTGTAAGASGGSGDISAKLGTIFWYGAVSN